MVAKKRPELPRTFADEQIEVEAALSEVSRLFTQAREAVKKIVDEHFASHGGCPTCGGRGWLVVWDTLDSLSGCYAEYGTCTNPLCTEETRKTSGLASGYNVYDKNRGVKDPVESHPAWQVLTAGLTANMKSLNDRLDVIKVLRTIKKMDEVVVVKGRKTPIGLKGRVFWIGTGEWGTRVGIQAADGTTAYTALSNVEKVAT